ncbi:MAG: tRNA (adenosine(37)-N6)-threonylcarbamoyltransferase complex dimerization subunit type 1 TsaB, partial [Saprospiraceae bacterium]
MRNATPKTQNFADRMARILLIETATDMCSAAIAVDGQVVALAEEFPTLQHAALLTLQVQECVRQAGIPLAELDAVAISRGPGSYTSLRVGASVAKGICFALDKPLIAVDTLLALAEASREQTPDEVSVQTLFLPMVDARRQEVWLAVYDEQSRLLAPAQPLILENNLFEDFIGKFLPFGAVGRLVLAGNGMEKMQNVPKFPNS